jgi:hypothetical protein
MDLEKYYELSVFYTLVVPPTGLFSVENLLQRLSNQILGAAGICLVWVTCKCQNALQSTYQLVSPGIHTEDKFFADNTYLLIH